jgi:hypothetical protein
MAAFRKELLAEFRSPVPLVAWLSLSVVVSIMGPFGSYGALTLVERALFWTPLLGLGVLIGTAIRVLVFFFLGPMPSLKSSLLIAALNCLLMAPGLYALIVMIVSDAVHVHVQGVEIAVLIASVSLGICALRQSVSGDPEQKSSVGGGQEPRLLRRLDPELCGEIWAISVRDHYVDVQTSRGKTSLLMRFSDAMDEVDARLGGQVHRSHWVAWSAVTTVCREGGKLVLQLKSGQQIPVSRNHRAKVDARFPPAPGLKGDTQRGAA